MNIKKSVLKIWENRLKISVYLIGWFGSIYRIAAILILSIQISREDHTSEFNVYLIIYNCLLTYCFISLLINFIFIVGVSKNNHYYLLPYLIIYGMEIIAVIICIIDGIILAVSVGKKDILSYGIPSALLALAAYSTLWWPQLRLFSRFKLKESEESHRRESLSGCKYVSCTCICFNSNSLDIATPEK